MLEHPYEDDKTLKLRTADEVSFYFNKYKYDTSILLNIFGNEKSTGRATIAAILTREEVIDMITALASAIGLTVDEPPNIEEREDELPF